MVRFLSLGFLYLAENTSERAAARLGLVVSRRRFGATTHDFGMSHRRLRLT